MMKGDILIVAAVPGELEGLIPQLAGATSARAGGREILRGHIGRQAVRLLVSGPGIANTVQGLTAAIEKERPGLILQTGCGGGFRQAGLRNGDVAIATLETDVHLGLEPAEPDGAIGALPFSVIQEPGQEVFNQYPAAAGIDAPAIQSLETLAAAAGVKVYLGPFVTVATITTTAARADWLHRHFEALIENMEGAGAAHVAALYGLPFIEIRAVSNRVGDRDKGRWDLPLSFNRCTQAVQWYLENR